MDRLTLYQKATALWYALRYIVHEVSFANESLCPEVNHDCFESSLKYVTDCLVSSVKVLGIDSVQLPHPSGYIPLGCLDDEMVVVVHKTVGMTEPVVSSDGRG